MSAGEKIDDNGGLPSVRPVEQMLRDRFEYENLEVQASSTGTLPNLVFLLKTMVELELKTVDTDRSTGNQYKRIHVASPNNYMIVCQLLGNDLKIDKLEFNEVLQQRRQRARGDISISDSARPCETD